MAEKQRLQGKVAVVTGGSRGIGLAIAQAFAKHGCQVVIAGRNARSLKAAAKALRTVKVEAVQCNVTDPGQVDSLFGAVGNKYSRIYILVNNAGVAHALVPVERLSIDAWKQTIDTNLTGMFLCTRAALPLMHAGGTIVNNISVSATQPFEGMAAYNASKYGALGFTNVLREELSKQGIRVLALITGQTDTEIWD